MRNLLTFCFIFFASQLSAAETVMICNAENLKKTYYKLEAPFFGEKTVKQKIDGKWIDWCRMGCVEFEVYESGAMNRTEKYTSWDKTYPKEGVVANTKYFTVHQVWLDFEFGKRRSKFAIYHNKNILNSKSLLHETDDTYSCKIQGNDGYLKKFKGTIEGIFE